MKPFIAIAQTIVAVVIVILILLQERSSGLAGFLGGGGDGGGFYQTRRGMERVIFIGTIVLAALFVVLAVLQLILK